MPGIPLVSREAIYSRDLEVRAPLSEEELAEAEESLSVYCKPIELYNILQRRATKNPSFLERCLHYKRQEKHKRRVQVSISISGAIGEGQQTESVFPLYIMLARPVFTRNDETLRSSFYRCKRVLKLTTVSSTRAKFIMPEINKLSSEVNSGSLAMLLVSCADITNPKEIDLTKDHVFSEENEGYCLFGKIPVDFLHLSREKSPNIGLGERVQMTSTVSMQSCYMTLSSLGKEKRLSFQFPHNSEAVSILQQVPIVITAEELGAKDKSAYDLYLYNNIPTNSLPHVIRLRSGNVMFNYKYYNNRLQKTEVTEDYSCPFCLMKCASYKGLKCHLIASHDLFRYEFWVDEEYQVVVVFPRTETSSFEIFGNLIHPREQAFYFCHKPLRSRSPEGRCQNANHVSQLALRSDMPPPLNDLRVVSESVECDISHPKEVTVSGADGINLAGPDSAGPSVPESNPPPPALLQFAKTRKLSIERSEHRNQALLQRRHFFHSHRAQPMALKQVMAEEDSEDEVDDDVVDLEDRRMLDDFLDVTQDEKRMMHLWNSFIRKQRVLADAHIPWACEAFSDLHAEDLVQNPKLNWCWRVFLIKLWNHDLLNAKTINKCHLVLDKYRGQLQNQHIDSAKSKI